MEKPSVIYNAQCPICSREIAMYERRSRTLRFEDLHAADLDALGLTKDDAARRLHVVQEGRVIGGVDAFVILWRETPGFAWLARLVSLPGVRQVAGVVYDRMLAPILFAMHRRRGIPK